MDIVELTTDLTRPCSLETEFGGTAEGLIKLRRKGVQFKGLFDGRFRLEFNYRLKNEQVNRTTQQQIIKSTKLQIEEGILFGTKP